MPQAPIHPLSVSLFGPIEVRLSGARLPRLRSRKSLWLLALLALRGGRPVERAWLTATLWPESDRGAAMANLRSAVKDLRRALGSEATRLRSPTTRTLALDLTGAVVDVLAFDAALAGSDTQPPDLARAVALYSGPLLEDCAEEWAFQERSTHEQAYLAALETLAARAQAGGALAEAEQHLRRIISVDPLRESAHRALLQTLAAAGQQAAMLAAYQELCRLLSQMDAQPDPATVALFEELQAGSGPAARSPNAEASAAGSRAGYPRAQRVDGGAGSRSAATSLPCRLTRFIGREREIAAVEDLLAAHRLVTLTGAGGCGKSRLSLQIAAGRMAHAPDGVCYVELASLADPALVPQTVGTAFGLRETPARPILQALLDHLRRRSMLLVLDNCEHLAGALASLAETLLQACPRLRILATSRESLRLAGEIPYRVPPLSLPEGDEALSEEHLLQAEASQLFLDRACALRPDLVLSAADRAGVAEVCRRLDGMPLAIELAAARITVLSIGEIAARLDDRFRLLTVGSRTALPRHRTLRASVEWSYDLLSEAEQGLFRKLAVFAGGFDLAAVEAVGTEAEPLDRLAQLVERSLVVHQTDSGESRYRLLETIRQYAGERLEEAGEAPDARARHLAFFVGRAEEARPALRTANAREWLGRLERDHDNFRAALHWASTSGEVSASLRLVVSLYGFWLSRGYWSEGQAHLAAALTQIEPSLHTLEVADALNAAGQLAFFRADLSAARRFHERALAIRRELADPGEIELQLNNLGQALMMQGEYRAAREVCTEALTISRRVGNKDQAASALCVLGKITYQEGNVEEAWPFHEEALALRREVGYKGNLIFSLCDVGLVFQRRGEFGRARQYFEEALEVSRAAGLPSQVAQAFRQMGELAVDQREYDRARHFFGEALAIRIALGALTGVATCLEGAGKVALAQGDPVWAARLIARAAALREAGGFPIIPIERPEVEMAVASAGTALGEAAFAAAWDEGRRLSLDDACAYVRGSAADAAVPPSSSVAGASRSPFERRSASSQAASSSESAGSSGGAP